MIVLGLFIPFIGTVIGSLMVFFMRDKIGSRMESLLYGFASGVMISATMWSLLLPACEMAESSGVYTFVPTCIGFLFGASLFLVIDRFVLSSPKFSNFSSNKKRNIMLVLAITLHNIPEGMAVGAVFAGAVSNTLPLASAIALAIGIAVQNIPEGAIISLPLKSHGHSKFYSFLCGGLSGIVEPIFSFLTILLASFATVTLPYFLSFAGGAMIYVVVHELLPDTKDSPNIATLGSIVGFTLMMLLDLALG